MTPDGLLDDIEFEEKIKGADTLTQVLARETRKTRIDVAALRGDIQSLPCHQGENCPTPGLSRKAKVAVGGGLASGVIAIILAVIELCKGFIK